MGSKYDLFDLASNSIFANTNNPLEVDEVIGFIRNRWGCTYQLILCVKGKSLYLQMMWGYIEQQSFPMSKGDYLESLALVIEVINRLGKNCAVRHWLSNVKGKPVLGRALTLYLKADARLEEFVL